MHVITWISLFLIVLIFFIKKTGYIPIVFDVIYPMQLTEFTKSLYFERKKKLENCIFSSENWFS